VKLWNTEQYKLLMEEMEIMLSQLSDIHKVFPQLRKPLENFTHDLFEFNEAYRDKLKGYYRFYCVRGKMMLSLLAQRNTEALLDTIIEQIGNGQNIVNLSNCLKETLKNLERTIITITANINSKHQLKEDLKKCYERVKNLDMEKQNIWGKLENEQKTLFSLDREGKNVESTITKIEDLATMLNVLDGRLGDEMRVAKRLEDMLILSIDCDDNTSRMLSEAFNRALILFVSLADVVSQLSTIFSTSLSLIKSTSKTSWEVARGILDTVTKLIVGGEYMALDSFTIGQDPTFAHLIKALTQNKNEHHSPVKPEDIF